MKTLPFFQFSPPVPHLAGLVPKPERYPFHDNDACPAGQVVKQRGQWQLYEPRSIAETRPRCPTCIALNHTRR